MKGEHRGDTGGTQGEYRRKIGGIQGVHRGNEIILNKEHISNMENYIKNKKPPVGLTPDTKTRTSLSHDLKEELDRTLQKTGLSLCEIMKRHYILRNETLQQKTNDMLHSTNIPAPEPILQMIEQHAMEQSTKECNLQATNRAPRQPHKRKHTQDPQTITPTTEPTPKSHAYWTYVYIPPIPTDPKR